jgi:hypothetical protein
LHDARIERIKSLTDEVINLTKYPYIPKKIRREKRAEKKAAAKAIINSKTSTSAAVSSTEATSQL